MKTTTAQNNHIVRFKTSAEIGGTLAYIETDTGRQGYINTNSSNNAAFISKNNDGTITCKLSGVEMKVPESSVKSIVSYSEGNVSYYYANEGKFIHKYSYINASSVAMSSCWGGFQPNYIKSNTVYYSYDGHYFYTSFSNMISDYKNKVHNHAVNNNDPYYSYYQ